MVIDDPLADPALRGPGLWRSLKESFGGARRPLHVLQVEVSSHCPGKCAYCPHTTKSGQWKARHMRPETLARLWPLLLQTSRVHLQGWGEPLLHPRFLDFAAFARRADCQVSTTTCGLVMHEKLALGLVASGIDIIAFSLTGATEESNNAARAGVDFAQVRESIRLLDAVRRKKMAVHMEIHLAYLMLASKAREVLLLPELMRDLGAHAAVVSTLDYIVDSEWEGEAFAPDETDKIAEARTLLDTAAAEARKLGRAVYYALPVQKARATCLEDPFHSAYADADGLLSPCIYTNLPTTAADPMRRVLGGCRERDPLDIWKSAEAEAFRAALASGAPGEPCKSCPKRFALGNREAEDAFLPAEGEK